MTASHPTLEDSPLEPDPSAYAAAVGYIAIANALAVIGGPHNIAGSLIAAIDYMAESVGIEHDDITPVTAELRALFERNLAEERAADLAEDET